MKGKVVPPELGLKSFNCPHCGAIAHQSWYKTFAHGYEKDAGPWMPDAGAPQRMRSDTGFDVTTREKFAKYFERILAKEVFLDVRDSNGEYSRSEIANLYVSVCFSCGQSALWAADNILYPPTQYEIVPNEDLPNDIRRDFLEAAAIVNDSPRGAAALLRLCIQKIMRALGENGQNLNDDIGALVRKGLDPRIQQALDVVRVIGNNSVHPGQIDIKDNKATAIKLFNLINVIADAMISTPKHIKEMYDDVLPEAARKQIEKRDSKIQE